MNSRAHLTASSLLACATVASAQTPAATPIPAAADVLPLTLEQAEMRALDRNPNVAIARLGTQAATLTLAESRAAYSPSFTASLTQRSQTSPSTNQLSGGQQVTTAAASYSTGITQPLPWGGGQLDVDFTGSRTSTSNLFSTYNPSFASGVAASFTQPLLRVSTSIRRARTLGSQITGTVPGGYLDVLRSLGALDYPTWRRRHQRDHAARTQGV